MNPELGEYGDLMMMPAAIALFAMMFVACLAVAGYSMKWSVGLVDAGRIGFLYALMTSIIASVAGGITTVGLALATGTQNQFVLVAYSAVASIAVLALMVQCNPFKAFLVYLCNMVIGSMMMFGVTIVGVLLLLVMSATNVVKLPSNAPAMTGTANENWVGENWVGQNWTETSSSESSWGSRLSESQEIRYVTDGGGGLQTNPFAK
tara:strand:+ start:257361 stop:257978 length:618 start_codon:yes stop_codon:yes gene_type:complete